MLSTRRTKTTRFEALGALSQFLCLGSQPLYPWFLCFHLASLKLCHDNTRSLFVLCLLRGRASYAYANPVSHPLFGREGAPAHIPPRCASFDSLLAALPVVLLVVEVLAQRSPCRSAVRSGSRGGPNSGVVGPRAERRVVLQSSLLQAKIVQTHPPPREEGSSPLPKGPVERIPPKKGRQRLDPKWLSFGLWGHHQATLNHASQVSTDDYSLGAKIAYVELTYYPLHRGDCV